MHIISKEKDYYDSIARQYEDRLVPYVRKPREYSNESKVHAFMQEYPFTDYRPQLSFNYRYNPRRMFNTTKHFISVLFCGKIYRGIRLTIGSKVCWDIESLKTEIMAVAERRSDIPRHREYYLAMLAMLETRKSKARAGSFLSREKSTVAEWLDANGTPYDCKYAVSQKIPIILVDYVRSETFSGIHRIIENPSNLHSVDFARVVPPWEAYQELSMYIGGVLGADATPIVHISDTDLRMAKGFTDCSFKSCNRDTSRYRTSL